MSDVTAAGRWGAALAQWGIPDEILAQAPVAPWAHPPHRFKVGTAAPPDTPSHRVARAALQPLGGAGTVLDVGCGGGASSMPLAPLAESITGVDESEAMLANFAAACDERGVAHAEVQGRWPDVAARVPVADVVVNHHTAYNVPDIGEFVAQLAAHARSLVVVELPERHPVSPFNPLWERFWGLVRPSEPSAELFVEVVRELGFTPQVERFRRVPRTVRPIEEEDVEFTRQRLCLTADRDDEVRAALAERPLVELEMVTVWWEPAG